MSSLFKLFTIVEMLLLVYLLDHGVSMRGYLTGDMNNNCL